MAKVLFASSSGGHLEQLKFIIERTEAKSLTVVTTTNQTGIEKKHELILMPDCNKDKPISTILALIKSFKIILKHSPNIVISTGAAPGLAICCAARVLNIKTIWIDSVANISNVSLSGRIAEYVVDDFIVQWPHLENSRRKFKGTLL